MTAPFPERPDPLLTMLNPERVFYDTGVLLDQMDFRDEQTYHRGRLARALVALFGWGTIAGLRVYGPQDVLREDPLDDTSREIEHDDQLVVEAGLAIDRLGRLIEIPRRACLRVDRWFEDQLRIDERQAAPVGGGGAPETVFRGDIARFAEAFRPGMPAKDALMPPDRSDAIDGIVADLFLRYVACERGLTPAFASGPYDATDAVKPARIRDGFELELRLRKDPLNQVVTPLWTFPDEISEPEKVFALWPRLTRRDESSGALMPRAEHDVRQDPSSVFLARVVVKASLAGQKVTRAADGEVRVLNLERQFVYSAALLDRLLNL